MFVGREKELQFLNDKYNSKNDELILLYGMRSIGKKETLKQFCKDKKVYFIHVKDVQMQNS